MFSWALAGTALISFSISIQNHAVDDDWKLLQLICLCGAFLYSRTDFTIVYGIVNKIEKGGDGEDDYGDSDDGGSGDGGYCDECDGGGGSDIDNGDGYIYDHDFSYALSLSLLFLYEWIVVGKSLQYKNFIGREK